MDWSVAEVLPGISKRPAWVDSFIPLTLRLRGVRS